MFGSAQALPRHPSMSPWLVGWLVGGGEGRPWKPCRPFLFWFILFFETSLSGARWGRAMQEAERSGSPPPSSAITSSPNQPTGRRLQVRDEPRGHECFTVCSKKSNILGGDTHPVALGCKYFFFIILTSLIFFFTLMAREVQKNHREATFIGVKLFSFHFSFGLYLHT